MGRQLRSTHVQMERTDGQCSSDPFATTSPNQSHSGVASQLDGTDAHQSKTRTDPMRPYFTYPMGHGNSLPNRRQHQVQVIGGRSSTQQTGMTRTAVSDLLPYCTTVPPLSEAQVIALSDIAGSLQELVLLSLGAVAGDARCVRSLEGAVGEQAAADIAEFIMDEWEIEG